ncbi:PREDICTED: segmentation protein cap'n'collar-like, partial [Rhagoletis zephyria]|uniref:segmentation protein cap'n'collar-like n=1 Tax=Rhagoletis zephyria TaxID=28612 RepID=UPI00081197E7
MRTYINKESEIIDVLWKQDVDLGYTLTPPHLLNSSSNGKVAVVSDDDIEKLKALEYLKLDQPNFEDKDANVSDIDDEWAGIPFTVDNETGEFIRLPLDEILNDVLQLAEFGNENNESNNDSIASTSKAAAAKNNKTNNDKPKSETGEEELIVSNSARVDNDKDEDFDKDSSAKTDGTKVKEHNNAEEEGYIDDFDLSLSEIEVNSLPSPLFDLDDEAREELADFNIMLQSAAATPSPFHHHPHQRGAGMQTYVGGGANSAFHRQATGFHHGHHQ